jgi:hypothetical protein
MGGRGGTGSFRDAAGGRVVVSKEDAGDGKAGNDGASDACIEEGKAVDVTAFFDNVQDIEFP